MSEPQVVNAFLRRYVQDRAEGDAKPLAHYQALFPGHEALIAEYFERCAERAAEGGPRRFGPFEVIREIGRDGQGIVYLAEDTRLGRKVALKVLSGLRAPTPVALDRLLREARIASQLDHPGICAVHEASLDAGVPYIAMQYIEGTTLAKKIATTRERLTPESSEQGAPPAPERDTGSSTTQPLDRGMILETIGLVEKAARSLHAAHEAGIVHRDVKPGNIMVTPHGNAVLLDFGLAREEDSDLSSLTQSGEFFGTPAYMSPEQLGRKVHRLDRRTDVWSLGVTLYEALTLRRPFEALTREALYRAISAETPPDPRRINAAIPKDVRAVLDTALEKDRDRRYQTAEAFADDLRAILEKRPVAAKPIGPFTRLVRWAGREPAKAGLLTMACVAVPTISALITMRIKDQPRVEAQRLAEAQALRDEHLAQGSMHLEEFAYDQAISDFKKALDLDHECAEAVLGIAVSESSAKRYLQALQTLEAHAATVEHRYAAIALRNGLLKRFGRAAESRPLPPMSDPLDYELEGLRALAEGKSGNAKAFVRARDALLIAILRSKVLRLPFYTEAVHAAAEAGDRFATLALEDALAHLWPQSGTAHYWRGFALGKIGEDDRAIAAHREAIRCNPDLALSHFEVGYFLARRGDRAGAVQAFREAVRLRPDDAKGHLGLGSVLGEQQEWPEAFAELQRAIELNPSDWEAHFNHANTLDANGSSEAAIGEYRKSLALKNDVAGVHFNLGNVLFRTGSIDDAITEYRKALEYDRNNFSIRFNLGEALRTKGQLVEAIEEYRKAMAINSHDPDVHYSLAQALEANNDRTAAIEEYRAAIHELPTHANACSNLGLLLGAQGELDAAIGACRKAAELAPRDPFNHVNLSQVLLHKGDYEGAADACRAALAVASDLAEAHCNLGHALRECGLFRAALEEMRRGDELGTARPKWPYQSGTWVSDLEGLVRLEDRMLAVASGKDAPAAGETLELADTASRTHRWQLAAGWYAAVFEQERELLDAPGNHAIEAARAVVQAASGAGVDSRETFASALPARSQALEWLTRDFRNRQDAVAPSELRRALSRWLADPLLAPVRDEPALSSLPPDEQRAWKQFWSDVANAAR